MREAVGTRTLVHPPRDAAGNVSTVVASVAATGVPTSGQPVSSSTTT